MIKIFAQTEQVPEILKDIKTGAFLKIRGVTTIDRFDGQLSIGSVFGIKKNPGFPQTEGGHLAGETCGTALSHKNE